MKYIFIRHGKTHFNEIGLKQGWCDSPLTKEGIQQIEKMSQLLKDEKIAFPGNASAYILCKKNNEYKLEKYLRL